MKGVVLQDIGCSASNREYIMTALANGADLNGNVMR